MRAPIYLDYNATTPIDPAVRAAMAPFLDEHFGNPSSTHVYGQTAHAAVERARAQVAMSIGADPDEIVFTASGSEASNHAIKGSCWQQPTGLVAKLWRGSTGACHIITSAVEHPATAQPIEFLRRRGCPVTILPVDKYGQVDPEAVVRAITKHTRLVSIMHANNEVGTIMPIEQIAPPCRAAGVLLHVDCAQSLGKIPVAVKKLGVDLLTIAGHKIYAPKGIGALYVRKGLRLESLVHGAGHEGGRRAGTENVPYIVALGQAAELAAHALPSASSQLLALRQRLHTALSKGLGDGIALNGHPEQRLPNTLNLNFVGHTGAELLAQVPGIAASTGSACHEGRIAQSPVLCAMNVPPALGKGAIRLSVGRFSTTDEVDRAAELLIAAARRQVGKTDNFEVDSTKYEV